MLLIKNIPFIPRRKRRAQPPPTPPGVPLALDEAEYDPDTTTLRLVFSRAIDISGLVGSAFVVADGVVQGYRFHVASATLDGPATMVAQLAEFTGEVEPVITLTASAGTGIVATDDGGTWPGVEGLQLPYP